MSKLEMHPCRCGGSALYVSEWGMDDQYVCNTCDYKTKSYYDGAEYAYAEWQKRNAPRTDGQGTLIFNPRGKDE